MSESVIDRIARLVGIADRYKDLTGRVVETRTESKAAILKGFGLAVEGEAQAAETLERIEQARKRLLPPLIPVRSDFLIPLRLQGAVERPTSWRIHEEDGATREGRTVLNASGVLNLPSLPMGYHRLRIEAGGESAESLLIAAPPRCFQPDALLYGGRLWGATAQIYGLRSERNLGIGDYSDIAEAAEGCGRLGASFLGLSPVHALFSADRTKISPYSPSSRLFMETLFIDPMAVSGFVESGAARGLEESRDALDAARAGALVDHAAVWDLKKRLLDVLWDHFKTTDGGSSDFSFFRHVGGEALQSHAVFEALSERFQAEGCPWLGDWPAPFRDARSAEIRAFAHDASERVAFHAWLQWLADRQFAAAAERARGSGMSVGLYKDLAVGADSAGSEIWSAPERFAASLAVGSPPDPFGPDGQNWGLPPLNPIALEEQGLAAFRALVAANMRHAGALRIDHAFQLQRLFVIPSGMENGEGAYVAYPFEAMLAALRIESWRARCLTIAEDLGAAPEGFSEAVMESGLLSYRVFWFEREGAGGFKPPAAYPPFSIATVSTHDLPTFRGWWRGLDIDVRRDLGVYDAARAESELALRATDRSRFDEALAAEGFDVAASEEPSLESCVRYLARAESVLVGVQFEDVCGDLGQANLPGPELGHPNWRRRLGADVGAVTAPDGPLATLAAALAEEGRGKRNDI